MVNWLDFSCVSSCPNGTYYNATTKDCPLCNPVCSNCTGGSPQQCIACNITNTGQQLYLEPDVNQCVLDCPKPYIANEVTNKCETQVFRFVTPLVITILVLIVLAIIVLILSKIVSCI